MHAEEKRYVVGRIKKIGTIWVANIPDLNLSSHGLNPASCVEGLNRIIHQLNCHRKFCFKIEVNDNYQMTISSVDKEFNDFLASRV